MTAWHRPHNEANECAFPITYAAEMWNSAARWWPAIAIGWELVLGRALAPTCEEERAGEGDEQATTERGRDKRPQCAARLVGCCCFVFLLIRQCVASARNVRLAINSLGGFEVSHLAGAGHG